MDKILIVADDFTGGLDAGVAFAKANIPTCVGLEDYFLYSADTEHYRAHVSIVPSRHMSSEAAYQAVFDVVNKALDRDYTCILKKTDSALRGNVGAELAAVLDATGEQTLFFIPAFPEMGRYTQGGIQYIDGDVPVAESVFGRDPFNPVHHSNVLDILAETTDKKAYLADGRPKPGIAVYDSSTEAAIQAIVQHVLWDLKGKVIAGCAGLANAIPWVLNLKCTKLITEVPPARLMVFCGSVNPISITQCDWAEACGMPRFHLTRGEKFEDESDLAQKMVRAARQAHGVVLDTGSRDIAAHDLEASREMIAKKISNVIGRAIQEDPDVTMVVIGGDTLLACIRHLNIATIVPVGELFPGVVLAKYSVYGEWRYLISKSGGFGAPDLLEKLSKKLASPNQTGESGGEK